MFSPSHVTLLGICPSPKYSSCISGYENAALKTQQSLALLNFGQNAIFSTALSAAMVLCSQGIMNEQMTIGDLVNFPHISFSISKKKKFPLYT